MPTESNTGTLLLKARSGSADALDAVFERCAARVLTLIRLRLGRRLRERLESRDVLQAVMLKAFLGFTRFRGENGVSFMAWLARIVENEIRDQADFHSRGRRNAAREVTLDETALASLPDRVRSLTSGLLMDERLERLVSALEALAPDHRAVIIGRYLEELSFADLGRRLERSPDACRMLLARGMAALTWRMQES